MKLFRSDWAFKAASLVQDQISEILATKGKCSVMLTGGRSGAALYSRWSEMQLFRQSRNIDYYFGDERCVPAGHHESNFRLAMDTLFKDGVPEGCSVHRMAAESSNLEAVADSYAASLPNRVDVLLLGVGEDGHIASLFPHHSALREMRRKVVSIVGPKPPACRLTITPLVIRSAHTVFVLAPGEVKASVLKQAELDPDQVDALPARMVLDANWILNTEPEAL